MSYRILFPKKDTTIYEYVPDLNAGVDQILELNRIDKASRLSELGQEGSVSRILMKFDINEVSSSIANSELSGSLKSILSIKSTESRNLNYEYTVEAFPLTQEWENGNGHYNDIPSSKLGARWGSAGSVVWDSGSLGYGYTNNIGGGSWDTTYSGSQEFNLNSPDIQMDITDIVDAWINGLPNYGIILKFSSSDESSDNSIGNIKFFSKETHTIYSPKLIVHGEIGDYSGSFLDVDMVGDDFVMKVAGLRPDFEWEEKVDLRVYARDRYRTKTHTSTQKKTQIKRLPSDTYYKIIDAKTKETVLDFGAGTKLQTDDDGHFITLNIENFMPKRYYELVFRVKIGNSSRMYKNKFFFKVER